MLSLLHRLFVHIDDASPAHVCGMWPAADVFDWVFRFKNPDIVECSLKVATPESAGANVQPSIVTLNVCLSSIVRL